MEATIESAAVPTQQTRRIVLFFAPTIFLSAFLLFWCEPMVGKMMLPLLGGAASVWITCLLFFQLMLLAGYGYAHALERYAGVRTQIVAHAALMLCAILFLPIQWAARPDASASAHPTLWLLGALIRSVGLPFCLVSTTAPLLQNWLSKTSAGSGRDPYFLYAISNAGSLLALLAYPVLIEPRWGVHLQSSYWFIGYVLLLLLVSAGAWMVWTHLREDVLTKPTDIAGSLSRTDNTTWRIRVYWVAAAFVPAGLMLAVTNHMLLNLASVPFLWIMPLGIYLLTFMIAFARRFRVPPRLLSVLVPIILLILSPLVAVSRPVGTHTLRYILGAHLIVLFAGALLCHTALASRRPDTNRLTEFYFWIALGGALGGVFVAVIAPFAFSTVLEYPLLVAMIPFFRETKEREARARQGEASRAEKRLTLGDWIYPAVIAVLVATTWYLFEWAAVDVTVNLKASLGANAVLVLVAYLAQKRRLRFALTFAVLMAGYRLALPGFLDDYMPLRTARDFFGIKRVVYDLNSNMRKLLHGDTLHGVESMDSNLIGRPLSYYHETGPVGDVMRAISDRADQHVGVVGLGTGSMAGWARPDRRITFFDIDPQVYDIAHNSFTFLRRCADRCDVVIGDGRLSIEKMPDGKFDVLMLDAFNSDSIPAHLVSREAVQLYLKKLKPDGMILFHVSNRYMDVQGLVSAVAFDAGLEGLARYDADEEPTGKATSDYVLAAPRAENFGLLIDSVNWTGIQKPEGVQPWTDDYSNMLTIVRWR